MFTGIVTDMGRVRAVKRDGGTRIEFETALDTAALELGASIACSGVCLTVIDRGAGWFAVEASAETLRRTTLGRSGPGSAVNLERPLSVGGEMGGHFVLGHVDGVARVVERTPEGDSVALALEAPVELARFIAPKGSVTLDGVSLTVNAVEGRRFTVNVIPHTARCTTLGGLRPGAEVNLEVDVLARYLERLAQDTPRG
jgi:riboflavin synthase